jgi:hypothetical protein
MNHLYHLLWLTKPNWERSTIVVETTQHVLFQCPIVRNVFYRICRWWEIEGEDLESFSEWQSWFLSIRMHTGTKNLLDGVFATFWWYMWGFRNRTIFYSSSPRRSVIFDDIVALSFTWVSSRCKKFFTWESWLKNPHLISL